MDNKYYVYLLLDQRKPGKYIYKDLNFSFLYEPIYVGKGSADRILQHFWKNNLKDNNYKNNKIKKIKRETGNWPLSIKIYENLTEDVSLILESNLIKTIGRKFYENGTLVNNLIADIKNGLSGENCGASIFKNDEIKLIRNKFINNDITVLELSHEYNVSYNVMRLILKNITYYDPNYIAPELNTRGINNYNSKFKLDDIKYIRNMYNIIKDINKIAEIYNVNYNTINKIIRNITYYDPNYIAPKITTKGYNHWNSKFNDDIIYSIRYDYVHRFTVKEISNIIGAREGIIRNILKNKSYYDPKYKVVYKSRFILDDSNLKIINNLIINKNMLKNDIIKYLNVSEFTYYKAIKKLGLNKGRIT